MKLESKIGKINNESEKIYNFLTNFDNFKNLVPEDKIGDWKTEGDTCTFSISPVGKTGFKLVEKEPHKLIKLTNLEETQYNFNFWVQLKDIDNSITAVKLTMDVELNPMVQMMAKKPLKEFLDMLVEKLGKINYS